MIHSLAHMNRTELIVSHIYGSHVPQIQIQAYDKAVVRHEKGQFIRQTTNEYRTALGVYRSHTIWTRPSRHGREYQNKTNNCSRVDYHTTITFVPVLTSRMLAWRSQSVCGQIERNLRVYPINPDFFNKCVDELYHAVHPRSSQIDGHQESAITAFQRKLSQGLNPFILDEYGHSFLEVSTHFDEDIVRLLLQIGVGTDACLSR